ncbi:MAG: tRNA 2-selenouridine(34) synthase MnmH [Bacteroidota bacterium]
MQRLPVEKFLKQGQAILDVRSPKEYEQGHIPGAISFPLFSNEERAKVGTLYKQEGKEKAFKEGLRIVGPKMVDFVMEAEALNAKQLHIYCWRGGMRSGSMGWLLSQAGFDSYLLEGGYKRYRSQLMNAFATPLNLRVLTGLTGSGKTLVLNAMGDLGAQILDLEAIANHKGSSFGNELSSGQPTTEQFQNDLYEALLKLDRNRPIWVEDESMCIGKVHLPHSLFDQMKKGKYYLLEVDLQERLDLLVDDYGHLALEQLTNATEKISKRLGPQNTTKAKAALEHNDLRTAAQLLLTYYDRQYHKSIDKKKEQVVARIDGRHLTPKEIAKKIISIHGH